MRRHTILSVFLSIASMEAQASFCPPPTTDGNTTPLCVTDEKSPRRKSLIKRFFQEFDNFDTTYVKPNEYTFTAMLQSTESYQSYKLTGFRPDGADQSLTMSPNPTFKLGPYFGWKWIFLGYTFEISRMGHPQKRQEFNLSLYSAMLGCDLLYIRNDGDFRIRRAVGFDGVPETAYAHQDFQGLTTTTAGLNVYYIFNHRRFSYPAAYSQTTVQRRSSGSWKVGFQYCRHKLRLSPELLPLPIQDNLSEQLRINEIIYNDYSVNVGYAYNWVFARNFLLAASASPAMGFKQSVGENGRERLFRFQNINFDVITRLGLVWNNAKWFAGASLISHMYTYRKRQFSLTNTFAYANIYVGFCFHKKKAKRPARQ